MNELETKIEKARYILDLKDNWDDEGSVAYSEKTFYQACDFIRNYFKWIWEEQKITFVAPEIYPGPYGSIDLFWNNSDYTFLINTPVYPDKIATYYGNDSSGKEIRGKFDIGNYKQSNLLHLLATEIYF